VSLIFFLVFSFYPCTPFYPPSFFGSPLTHHLQLQTSDPTTLNTTLCDIHFLAENLHCCMRGTIIVFLFSFFLTPFFVKYYLQFQRVIVVAKTNNNNRCVSKSRCSQICEATKLLTNNNNYCTSKRLLEL